MKRTVTIIWIVIAVLMVLFVFIGLRMYRSNRASASPTAIPIATSVQPTVIPSAISVPQTAVPTSTNVPPTTIPSATSVPPTAIPSATTIPPTVKPSATSTFTVKPSATRTPTAKPSATRTPTAKPSATSVPPTAKPTATVNPVQNILWQWISVTDQSTGSKTVVPNPGNYTISFYSDGTLSGLADCNTFKGTYSQSNGFTIKIGISTTTYCGETSLDNHYLQLLDNVAAGGPDGTGGLALETAGGAQRMLFKNGGAAPKP
jgi:heat shock protein HslJ